VNSNPPLHRRPRVALVRGAGLSVYEMQMYEPLLERYGLQAFGLSQHSVSLDGLKIPCVKLRWPDSVSGRSLSNAYRARFKHQRYYMPGLDKHLKEFEIVHSAEITSTYSWQAARAKKKTGVPLVITSTENIPFPKWDDPQARKVKAEIVSAADFFLALTPEARDVLEAEGVPGSKVRVIPFGLDLDRFCPEEPEQSWQTRFNIHDGEFVVLYVGRLVWEKGIYELVTACRRLDQAQLRLIIVGDGPEELSLKKYIRMLGMETVVQIRPAIRYGEIHNVYRLATVTVLPSIPTRGVREQFGLTVVESMACGIPVIASRCGSMPGVMGDAGLLVNPGDTHSLFESLERLRSSPNLRLQQSKLGRNLVKQRYDRQKVAVMVDEVYQSLLI
jgi:glycosyltransferase involved in cell wall biosynthesis